ncbi:MAG: hypothetical protein WC724_01745 [Candidatus Paceibacterota bacterium]|jgi:hypothetical protein
MEKHFVAYVISRHGQQPYAVNRMIYRKSRIVIQSMADVKKLEKELYESHFRGHKKYAGDCCTLVSIQPMPIK